MTQSMSTLFETLGGFSAIEAVVDDFYGRVLDDPNVRGFFTDTDMARQAKQQIMFISMALGGPSAYQGQDMRDAHENMNITEHDFDLIAGHLRDALRNAGVSEADTEAVIATVATLKADIVSA